ncbi:hypothetical protein PCI56_06250 [Plesiomonas shigelloides subsp. oncorhynchi]|nr:hypothetical protein [Plesiomonas shigelloides]
MTTIPSEPFVYVLKKSQTKARDFNSIGLSPRIRDFILDKKSTGLVLVGGPMNSGKTSTVATFFQERLNLLGGVGMALKIRQKSLFLILRLVVVCKYMRTKTTVDMQSNYV